MKRAFLIPLTGMMLLFMQIQCAAACAGDLCSDMARSESMPPCHRHHNHSQDQDPASCLHQTVSAPAMLQQAAHLEFSAIAVVGVPFRAVSTVLPPDGWAYAAYPPDVSPPGAASISSTVLRV